ncbi:hypothetical protein CA13_07280 [Planctomycetes bacterium CA13]|uniref:Leucine Rich repeats (2 copies) n=1 Tax=Novipirellula herctigrandis TaxID=2527986 RepID=A0A5C5YW85_9BACT|nr:hypothetical protein CA13_07280 [Planctomycetes bacterium CA13]
MRIKTGFEGHDMSESVESSDSLVESIDLPGAQTSEPALPAHVVKRLSRGDVFLLACLAVACIAASVFANYPLEQKVVFPKRFGTKVQFETEKDTHRLVKSAGYPQTYYRLRTHSDDSVSTSFDGWTLLKNILACGTLTVVVLAGAYWRRAPGKTRQLSIRDLLFLTFLAALPLGLWQISASQKDKHIQLASRLATQGYVMAEGRIPLVLAKLLPESVTGVSVRIYQVHLNKPSDSIVEEALAIQNLECLRLGGDTYSLEQLQRMRTMPQLMDIRIGGRMIDDQLLHTIASMPQVRELSFIRTNIDTAGLELLGDLPNLICLSLADTLVRMEDLAPTYPWSANLFSLELPRPRPGNSDSLALTDWPHLRELTIRSCSHLMNDSPVKLELQNLPELQHLTLDSMQAFELSIVNAPELTHLCHDNIYFRSRVSRFQTGPEAAWLTKLHIDNAPKLVEARAYGPTLEEVYYRGTPQLAFRADRNQCYFSGVINEIEVKSPDVVQKWVNGLGKSEGPSEVDLQELPLRDVDLSPLKGNSLIKSLDLTGSSMSDATMESIFDLAALKQLRLGRGQFDKDVLGDLSQKLPELEHLSTGRLADYQLTLHDHEHLRELRNNAPHLTEYTFAVPEDTWVCRNVDLSNLKLLEGTLKFMHPLQSLNVRNLPKLTELIAMRTVFNATLEGLSGLQTIGVGGPSITDEDVRWIDQCTTLTHVALPYTSLTDVGLKPLAKSESLVHLSIPGTKVTDKVITTLNPSHLMRVNLRDTNVTAASIRHILQSPELETFVFSAAGLTADDLSTRIKSRSLAILSIPHVKLTPAQLSALLKKTPHIIELDFIGVDIDLEMADTILKAANLKRLRVSDGKIDGIGVLKLAKHFPKLRFDFELAEVPSQIYVKLASEMRLLTLERRQEPDAINENPLVDEDALRLHFLSDS